MGATAKTLNTPGTQFIPAGVNAGGADYAVMFQPVIFCMRHTAVGATGDTMTLTVPMKCRVISMWLVNDASADGATTASYAVVSNGASNEIGRTLFSTTDNGVTFAAYLDAAYATVEAGGTLVSTWTENSSESNTGDLYIMVQPLL
jgi:hypothetical protein